MKARVSLGLLRCVAEEGNEYAVRALEAVEWVVAEGGPRCVPVEAPNGMLVQVHPVGCDCHVGELAAAGVEWAVAAQALRGELGNPR